MLLLLYLLLLFNFTVGESSTSLHVYDFDVFPEAVDFGFDDYNRGECPPNSIGFRLNTSICYSFHPSLSQYVIAERECNSFGATLVSLKNRYTNVYVTQLANLFFKHLEVEEFWSNGHRLLDTKTFRWINGDEIIYGDNLKNKRTEDAQDCMAVNLEKGFWKHENCFTRLPFVCEFIVSSTKEVPPTALTFEKYANFEMFPVKLHATTTPSLTTTTPTFKTSTTTEPKICPLSWIYNNATGFCYGVFHDMNWEDAEKKCIQEQAHLASIHSKEEAHFVAKLTEKNSSTSERHHWHGQTFVGFFTKDKGQTWEWSDGTPFDYEQWYIGEPNNEGKENCGQIWSYAHDKHFGDFNNFPCHSVLKNSVCKKLPN